MPNKHLWMKLSPEEETFLRHWMYEETHYRMGAGPAKRLQREHEVTSADLATLIAAALPAPAERQRPALAPRQASLRLGLGLAILSGAV
jgi:hypothetical protein